MQIQMVPIGKDVKLGDMPKLFASINSAVRDQVAEGVRYMTEYPPLPAGITDRRTGTLRRSWFFEVKSGSGTIEGTVNSNSAIAPYNKDVQGDNQLEVFGRIGWRDTNMLSRIIDNQFINRVKAIMDKVF